MINLMEINNQSILKDNNPILRQISKEVDLEDSSVKREILKMKKYLVDSNDEEIAVQNNLTPAVGIAAVQIGILKRFFLMLDLESGEFIEVINPTILEKSDELGFIEQGEGCLSVPQKKDGYIYRPNKIKVEYYDIDGKKITKDLEGYQAIIFQHEFDHLNGILYTDYIGDEPFKEIENAIKL